MADENESLSVDFEITEGQITFGMALSGPYVLIQPGEDGMEVKANDLKVEDIYMGLVLAAGALACNAADIDADTLKLGVNCLAQALEDRPETDLVSFDA